MKKPNTFVFNARNVCKNPVRIDVYETELREGKGFRTTDKCTILVAMADNGRWFSGMDARCNHTAYTVYPNRSAQPFASSNDAIKDGLQRTLQWARHFHSETFLTYVRALENELKKFPGTLL